MQPACPTARPTPRKPAVSNGLQRQSGVARAGGAAGGSLPARAGSRARGSGPPGCGGESWRTCPIGSYLEPAHPGKSRRLSRVLHYDETFHSFALFSLSVSFFVNGVCEASIFVVSLHFICESFLGVVLRSSKMDANLKRRLDPVLLIELFKAPTLCQGIRP